MSGAPPVTFGDVRALLHDAPACHDTWAALLSMLCKIEGEAHASLRAQITPYVQDRIARDDAWQKLSREAPAAWTHPLRSSPPHELLTLCNGITLETGYLSDEALSQHLDALDLAAESITLLEVDVYAEDADKVSALLDRFSHIQTLTCTNQDTLSFDVERWRSAAPHPHIKHLTMEHAKLGSHGFDPLLATPWLPQLERLKLGWNRLETHHIQALCEVGFTHLEELALDYCHLSAESLATLCDHEAMRHLRTLDLSLNSLHGECGEFLAQATFAEGIEVMHLGYNNLSDAGIMQLCTHAFPALRRLHIESNNLHATSIQRLAQAPFITQLEGLSLCFNQDIPADNWLALCKKLPRITHLDLSFCALTDETLRGLNEHLHDRPLQSLQLASTHHDNDPQVLIELLNTMPHDALRELSISSNQLTDAHMLALQRPFPLLTELFLEENPIHNEGLLRWLTLIPPHRLRMLSLGKTSLTRDAAMQEILARLGTQHISCLTLALDHTPDDVLLELVHACAPTLHTLTLTDSEGRARRFYEALAEIKLPHLQHFTYQEPTRHTQEHFDAFVRGELVRHPMLSTLTWRNADNPPDAPTLELPGDVHPWLQLIR